MSQEKTKPIPIKKSKKPKAKIGRPKKPIEETARYKIAMERLARKQKSIDDEVYKWTIKFSDIKLGEYAEKQCRLCKCVTKVKKQCARGRKKITQEEREAKRANRTEEEKIKLSERMSIISNMKKLKKHKKL